MKFDRDLYKGIKLKVDKFLEDVYDYGFFMENGYEDVVITQDNIDDSDFIIISSTEDEDFIQSVVDQLKKEIQDEYSLTDEEMETVDDKFRLWDLVNYGYSDSYTQCAECGKLVEMDNYVVNDCVLTEYSGYVHHNCLDLEGYIEDEIVNNWERCLKGRFVSELNLNDLGWMKYNKQSLESGYYEGMTDSPSDIYKKVSKEYEDVIFVAINVSPFHVEYDVYVRYKKV